MKKSISLLLSLLLIIGSFAGVYTVNVNAQSEYVYLTHGKDFTFTHFANNGFTPVTDENGVQTGLKFDPSAATDSSVRSYAAFGFTDSNTFSNLMGKTLCFAMDITVSSQTVDGAGDQPSMYMLLTGSADRSGSAVKDKVWSDRMYNVGWNTLNATRRISFVFTPEVTTDFNYINISYNGVGTFELTNITVSEYVECTVSANSADSVMGSAAFASTHAASVGTAPAGKLALGEEIAFSATANSGYTFDCWKDASGNTVSDDLVYKPTVTGEAISVTANFISTSGYVAWRQGEGNTFSHINNGGFTYSKDKSVLYYDPATRTDLAFVCLWGDDAHKITALNGKTVRLSMDITVISGADENEGIAVVGTTNRGTTAVYWPEHMYNIGYIEEGKTVTICTTFTVQNIGTANYIQLTCKSNSKFEIKNITLTELVGNVNVSSADETKGTVTALNTTEYQGGISGWTHKNHYPYLKDAQEYAIGEIATFTATANDGCIFENWTDGKGNIVSTLATYETTVTGDINLTANFKESEKAYVSFETFGGTLLEDVVGEVGKEIETPVPTKAGFYFEGWYTNKGCTSTFEGIATEAEFTLYAKWGKGYVQNFENANTVSKNGGMLLTSNPEGGAYSGNTVLEYDMEKADSANISKNRVIVNVAGADIPVTSALGTEGVFELSFKYRVLKGSVKFTICCGTSNVSAVPTGWYDSLTLTKNSDWQEFKTTITLTTAGADNTQDYINIWLGQPDTTVTVGQIYIDDVVLNPVNQNVATAYNNAAALRSKAASTTGKNGLRVYNKISKDYITNNNIVEFGSVAVFTQKLCGEELTVNTENSVLGVAYGTDATPKLWEDNDTSYIYTSYITNISDKNFDKSISVRAYAKDSDGNYYYGSVCEVGIYKIANSIDNGNTVDGSAVSDNDKAAFVTFIKNNSDAYAQWCLDNGTDTGDIYHGMIMNSSVTDDDMTAKTLSLSNNAALNNIGQNGRTLLSSDGITVEWVNSGFSFGGVFSGDVTLETNADAEVHTYVIVNNDYANANRVVIPAGESTVTLATGLAKDYYKITLDKSTDTGVYYTASAINYTGVLDDKPSKKALSIEFIGDSITSATSLYTEEEQPDAMLRDNSLLGFASLVARGLDADLSVVSRSGHAIVNHKDEGSNRIMDWYSSTLYTNKDSAWSGSSDIVVVALGTNDTPAYLDADKNYYDPEGELSKGVKALLTEVRAANPNAHIIYTYGMMDVRLAANYKAFVEEWKTENNDSNTYYLGLTRGDYCIGNDGHPNPEGHAYNAQVILSFIENNGLAK